MPGELAGPSGAGMTLPRSGDPGRGQAGFAAPAWLSVRADPGAGRALAVAGPGLGATVGVRIWAPSGTGSDDPLPLLVVHDGPEYEARAGLTQYLAACVSLRWLPPLRAALLSPGERDDWYSASPAYADALACDVLPAIASTVRTTVVAGMGTSLGALAMLHAHHRHEGLVNGLFLQSGSFFVPWLDGQEGGFRYFGRITTFTAELRRPTSPGRPVPVIMTCGMSEENLSNNRLTARLLAAGGYPVTLREVPGGHDYTAWRNALHPWLARLIGAIACGPAVGPPGATRTAPAAADGRSR